MAALRTRRAGRIRTGKESQSHSRVQPTCLRQADMCGVQGDLLSSVSPLCVSGLAKRVQDSHICIPALSTR